MAGNTLRFGGLEIPIVEEKNLTGDPAPITGSTLSFTAPLYELWNQGVLCAMEWVSAYTPTPDPDSIYTESYMPGGRTGLHGTAAELIVSKREQPDDGSTLDRNFFADWIIEDGGIEYDSGTCQYCTRTGAMLLNTTRSRYFKFVAMKFNFPDSYYPEWRRYGYYILAVCKQTDIASSSGAESITYSTPGSCVLNLPYINRVRETDLYIDEEDIPDDPFEPSEPEPYPVIPPTPDTSDTITIPGNPLIGVTKAGFINVYNPGMNALTGLGDILFPDVSTATDVMDAILKVCQALQNQNLINYIVDCHIIPVTPQTGSNANIKVGFRDTGISVPVVTNDYIDATCGSLSIPEFFHGYQDYAATRSKIYLPFIGFVDTKPEYWQAGTISVDYKFNIIDGSFMCYIRSVSSKSALNNSVIAQYSGNACVHFPITGVNYANMITSIVGTAATAAATGGASAVLGAAASATNTIMKGGDVQQSNGYGSSACMMGVRSAYLLIERAVPAFPSAYGHNKGYPANITTSLAAVSGFTTIEDIDLTGVPLTQVEIDELRGLLKEGVYF